MKKQQTATPSAALQRELAQAIRLNDTWLILRALHDEHMRGYQFDLARIFSNASEHVNA